MPTYPVSFNLLNKKCVVVGGGTIAERKIETLLEFGALVTVVSPVITPLLTEWAADGSITHIQAIFEETYLDDAFLVIAATDDRTVNEACSIAARERGIPVNVVDDPELCTFIVPAVVRRGDLVISISTSGRSPALARRIREQIETSIGPEYGDLVDVMNGFRDELKAKYSTMDERNAAYVRIMDSDVLELLNQGKHAEAVKKARDCI